MTSPPDSVMSYGKFDDDLIEEQSVRRRSNKRMLIISISSVVLVAAVVTLTVGLVSHSNNKSTPNSASITSSSMLGTICNATRFPSTCISSITQFGEEANTKDPQKLFKLSLFAAKNELSKLQSFTTKLIDVTNSTDEDLKSALDVCEEVLNDAVFRLNNTISSNSGSVDDLRTWLSAVLTNQETCLDSLREMESSERHLRRIKDMESATEIPSQLASNSLAIVTTVLSLWSNIGSVSKRKLLGSDTEFPSWMSLGDRRLLVEAKPKPNLTVAKDGSGNFTMISEAVAKTPIKSMERFVIYIKEGTYDEEYVEIPKHMWNLTIYGDGMDKTVISGHKSVNGSKIIKTFATASFAVNGDGFIGTDIKFVNTAGPQNGQAVAFRSGADRSVCHRCKFEGFQDTLYVHHQRQFYRECDIIGTVDFIFGNAAAVFQNCRIMPREPLQGQSITITAQGKKEWNESTGISIQNCEIFPMDNQNVTAKVYLGRPWKDYATTVVIRSNIHSFLDPAGWSQWNASLPPKTIFYGEFENFGEGSSINRRVNWTGYYPSLTDTQVAKFSIESFLNGPFWLLPTSVPFD
ncbi:Plant invertase/pectin methylesterase inhibitor superfamily [Euphorbia peplus]|nr:Plant invertase/pectin methylesterase inhibitor superfamily [Euphorbia peplus]